jgi:hypothetical protein
VATQTATANPKQDTGPEQQLRKLREIYADAPEVGRVALEKIMGELEGAVRSREKAATAGRIGLRQGKISELTSIVKLKPGGAKRLTLHTMRFVFFDNDTRLLFATAFDGDWDTYIDDFVAKIPDYLDIIDSAWDGWPGIRSPGAKDYLVKLVKHQITAEGWYVAFPALTVAEIHRLKRIGTAVDEFLDKVG